MENTRGWTKTHRWCRNWFYQNRGLEGTTSEDVCERRANKAQVKHHLINCSCVLPEHRAARWWEGCEWSLWSCCGQDNTNVYGVAATPETNRIRHRRRYPLTRVWLRGPWGPRWIIHSWARRASCFSSPFFFLPHCQIIQHPPFYERRL